MTRFSGQPSRKTSLTGHTDEGDEVWIIRSISQKFYNCLGCHGPIEIGDEHVVVQYVGKYGGTEVKVDGEDLLVMREEDVMAIIEK